MNLPELVQIITEALLAKKAQDLVILDLHGLTIIADYFVIATGTSGPQIDALTNAVLDAAKAHGVRNVRHQGTADSSWVLLDLGDIVVHIFSPEQRDFYKLERLWADAERLPVPEGEGA